jgi:hypothetical protein
MKRSTPIVVVLGLVLVFALCACPGGGEDDDGVDAGLSPACMAAQDHSDLTWIQTEIFAKSCRFSSCHDASQPEADIDMSTKETSIAGLVNVQSTLQPTLMRVVPGDVDASYLAAITDGSGPLDPMVGTMPQNAPLLCTQKLDAIKRWIMAGAMND